jgi:hypothetical protein
MTKKNPFVVLSPEQLDASYIAENFVDVFTDLPRLRDPCNTFIAGARGTGKSMLLRSLEPEVMLKSGKVTTLTALPYFSVHVPLRKAEFGVTELRRLAGYASVAIGEHLLVMHVMFRLASSLEGLAERIGAADAIRFRERFDRLFELCGGAAAKPSIKRKKTTPRQIFSAVKAVCEEEIIRVRQYYARLPFSDTRQLYNGALVGFLDFLVPLATIVSQFGAFSPTTLYIMLDDADNLPQHLQRVLNSWVSTRSTHVLCLKITTQLGYATYRTVDNLKWTPFVGPRSAGIKV